MNVLKLTYSPLACALLGNASTFILGGTAGSQLPFARGQLSNRAGKSHRIEERGAQRGSSFA